MLRYTKRFPGILSSTAECRFDGVAHSFLGGESDDVATLNLNLNALALIGDYHGLGEAGIFQAAFLSAAREDREPGQPSLLPFGSDLEIAASDKALEAAAMPCLRKRR